MTLEEKRQILKVAMAGITRVAEGEISAAGGKLFEAYSLLNAVCAELPEDIPEFGEPPSAK